MKCKKKLKNLDKIYLAFFKLISMFFALQAFLSSVKSFLMAGSSDREIHTITSISSVLTLKSFNGVHSNLIVFAKFATVVVWEYIKVVLQTMINLIPIHKANIKLSKKRLMTNVKRTKGTIFKVLKNAFLILSLHNNIMAKFIIRHAKM